MCRQARYPLRTQRLRKLGMGIQQHSVSYPFAIVVCLLVANPSVFGQPGNKLHALLAELEASQQISIGDSGNLAECLVELEKRNAVAHQQLQANRRLQGEIQALNGPIAMQRGHQRQAELMPGIEFNPTVLVGLLGQQRELQLALQQQESIRLQTIRDNDAFEKPVLQRLDRYQAAYSQTRQLIRESSTEELARLVAILEQQGNEPTTVVLKAIATVRCGADHQRVSAELVEIAPALQSSLAMGMSQINLDRLLLSILLETPEDTDGRIASIKKNKPAMKHAGILYVVGTHCAAKGKFSEATRHIRNARNRTEDNDYKGLLAAEIVFYEFCKGEEWNEEKHRDLIRDVENIVGDDATLGGEWQIQRAKAVLAASRDDGAEMRKREEICKKITPPLALRHLLEVTGKKDSSPKPKSRPVGID